MYVEYDDNAFPYPQTIGSTADSIVGLGPADESMIDTIFIMPNKSTNPDATLMIVVDEVTTETNPKTYQYVYVGNINDLPSDVLTEGSIVNDLSTGGTDKPLSAEQGRTLNSHVNYTTCGSGASDQVKLISDDGFELSTHLRLLVMMTNTNTNTTPKFNINNTGVKDIWYNGSVASDINTWSAGEVLDVYYDGTNYIANTHGGAQFSTSEKVGDVGIDDEPTAGSDNLVKSGGVFENANAKLYSSYTIDIYGAVFAGIIMPQFNYIVVKLNLAEDCNNLKVDLATEPTSAYITVNIFDGSCNAGTYYWKVPYNGERYIRFYKNNSTAISSESNYEIYSYNLTQNLWDESLEKLNLPKQIDSNPTNNSNNFVTSGGVKTYIDENISDVNNKINDLDLKDNIYPKIEYILQHQGLCGKMYTPEGGLQQYVNKAFYHSNILKLSKTASYWYSGYIPAANDVVGVVYFDRNFTCVGYEFKGSSSGGYSVTEQQLTIPENAVYFAVSSRNSKPTIKVYDYKEEYLKTSKAFEILPNQKTQVEYELTANYRLDFDGTLVSSSSGIVSNMIQIDKTKQYRLKTYIDMYRAGVGFYNSSAISAANYVGCALYNRSASQGFDSILEIPKEANYMIICSAGGSSSIDLTTVELSNSLAKNVGSENSGKVLVVDSSGNVVPSDLPEDNRYVQKEQGIENEGKFLKVGSDGNVTLGDGSASPEDITSCVRKKLTKTLYLGQNLISGVTGSGTGWSHSSGAYTHSVGNEAPLVFDFATTNGDSYVAILKTNVGNFLENYVNVSIGDGELCDVYNGTTGPFYIGMKSDGGSLKITPGSDYSGTVYDIELRKIVTEELADITVNYSSYNVDADTMVGNLTCWWNVAIGANNALQKLQNGSRNISIGTNSMTNLESGERNIGIGTFTMNTLKYGIGNVAIGADALYRTAKSSKNVAIGKAACGYTHSDTSHTYTENVALGDNALGGYANSYIRNVMVGALAGYGIVGSTTVKERNVAVGYQAGYYGAYGNVSIGYRAGYYSKGDNNVFIGNEAQKIYVTGEQNVFIGALAYGSDGTESASNIVTISNSIAIGYNTHSTKSNQIMLGSTNHTELVVMGNKKIIFNQDGSVTWTTLS